MSEHSDSEDGQRQAERGLTGNTEWKQIQQNTFTRWANEHLKSVDLSIDNLETDLSDGLRLIALVEVLSQKSIPRYNKKPNFRVQKLENVSVALEVLQEEGIKLVNIDSSDIVDGNLKLILGLMWALILHYSISMPKWDDEEEAEEHPSGSGPTPKQRLLNWINLKIPDMSINNFTTDWTSGLAVGALVDGCAPGLCPDWESWDPNDGERNATEAMDLADDWLDVRQLIRPEELVNPNVDEQSMMTYLAQYPNAKLKPDAPLRHKTDHNCVRVYGPGIEHTRPVVGAPVHFMVETHSAGEGELEVAVEDPFGAVEQADVHFNHDENLTYTVSYTPKVEGLHKVFVRFAGHDIPYSPFEVMVEGFAVVEEEIEEAQYVPDAQEPTEAEVAPPGMPSFDEYFALPITGNTAVIDQLWKGMCFTFSGRISHKCKTFFINFVYDNNTRDIALHINPRLQHKTIVRNTQVRKVWGREELASDIPFPFKQGERCEIQVLVTDDGFLISVNKHHLAQYSHRQPYAMIKLLEVSREIEELQIYRHIVRGYPLRSPGHTESCELPLVDNSVEIGQLFEGISYIFTGKIAIDCNEFAVNFLYDKETRNNALHIKPRFPQKCIVRNTRINNKWGHEEVSSALPFLLSRSGRFTIQVLVTDTCYLISINGHHFAQYTHRLPYNDVRLVNVKGDVEDVRIHRCRVQGYPQHLPEMRPRLLDEGTHYEI